MEKSVLEEERDKIRELHQRQQDSLKSLQALENRFCHVALDDEETLRGSSIASRVPTLELMANAPVMELPPLEKPSKPQKDTITIDLSTASDSDTSDSDATMSGDDNEEHISTEELAKAADHVKKLLKRITTLQKSFDVDKKKHRKRHVHKMFQRFCRKFESGIKLPSAGDPPKFAPFIDFGLNDSGGALECFDFDSFLHVPGESTPFPLLDLDFSGGEHSEPQQTTNLDAIPSMQSPQHPPLVSHESVEPIPLSTAYTLADPPIPAVDAALGSSSDPSAQQLERSLDQGRSLLARASPDLLVQIRAQMQMQNQVTPQPQAETQHSPLQSPQVTPHDARFQISGIGQILPSPATRKLRRSMLPPISTPSSGIPPLSEPMIPPQDRSLSPGFNRSPHYPHPQLDPDLALLPQPPIGSTALQDYQYQLMMLEQQRKKRLLVSRQQQDEDSHPMMGSIPVSSGWNIPSLSSSSSNSSIPVGSSHSRKKASHEPNASAVTHSWSNVEDADKAKAQNRMLLRGRKRALTAEQRSNAARMRIIASCSNCQRLKLKVK